MSPDYKTCCKCSLPEELVMAKQKKSNKRKISSSMCKCEKGNSASQKTQGLPVLLHPKSQNSRKKEGRMKGYADLAAYKKQRRILMKANIVDTRTIKGGQYSVARPKWYHCIALERRARLDDLNSAIYNDHCGGVIAETSDILNYIGMYPRLNEKLMKTALGKATPVEFLMSLIESTADSNVEGYTWNQSLLMSSVCIFEFPILCAQLKEITCDIIRGQVDEVPSLRKYLDVLSEQGLKCLSFPDIEIHPELIKHFRLMAEAKISTSTQLALLAKTTNILTSVRYAFQPQLIPFTEASYKWDSIYPLRRSHASILKKFYDKFMQQRIETAQDVWMAFHPFHFFDKKMLQLFSSYLVSRFEKSFRRY